MSEYLYVCHFSNGHIKVGRSIHPKSRIASHADRVACMGIELVEHHIVECAGHSAPAEAELIERCVELATRRNKNEWFEGLDYLDICIDAERFASVAHKEKEIHAPAPIDNSVLEIAIFYAGGVSSLAKELGVKQPTVSNWRMRKSLSLPWEMALSAIYASQIKAHVTTCAITHDATPESSGGTPK